MWTRHLAMCGGDGDGQEACLDRGVLVLIKP